MDGFALGVLFYFFDNIKPKQITTIMSSIIVVIGDVIIVFKNVLDTLYSKCEQADQKTNKKS